MDKLEIKEELDRLQEELKKVNIENIRDLIQDLVDITRFSMEKKIHTDREIELQLDVIKEVINKSLEAQNKLNNLIKPKNNGTT